MPSPSSARSAAIRSSTTAWPRGAERCALGVPAEDVVEQRAGRRLAALVQPQPGHHRAEIRAPHARHPARPSRQRHVAGRGAGDQRERCDRARRRRGRAPGRARRARRHAHRSGRSRRCTRWSGRARRGGLRVERAERCPDRARRVRHRGPLAQVLEPDRGAGNRPASPAPRGRDRSICRSPCSTSGRSSRRRGRSGSRRGRASGRSARQASGRWRLSHISFGISISGDIVPPSIVEHPMAGGGALVGLGDGAMIEPDHDVPAVLAAGRRRWPDGPRASRATSEQVASNDRPATSSGATPAWPRASRTAPRDRRPRCPPNSARRGPAAAGGARSAARRGRASGRRGRTRRRVRCRSRRRPRPRPHLASAPCSSAAPSSDARHHPCSLVGSVLGFGAAGNPAQRRRRRRGQRINLVVPAPCRASRRRWVAGSSPAMTDVSNHAFTALVH